MVASTAPAHLQHITQVNQVNSPFLRLPAELRNAIYNIVFSEDRVVKVHAKRHSSTRYTKRYVRLRGAAALFATSRQLYGETYPMFMSTITFDIRSRGIQDFVDEFSDDAAVLVASIIADGADGGSRDTGSWVVLGRTKGKLTGLKRAHIEGFCDMSEVKSSKLGSMLDWVTGDRVGKKGLEVTTSMPDIMLQMCDFTPVDLFFVTQV